MLLRDVILKAMRTTGMRRTELADYVGVHPKILDNWMKLSFTGVYAKHRPQYEALLDIAGVKDEELEFRLTKQQRHKLIREHTWASPTEDDMEWGAAEFIGPELKEERPRWRRCLRCQGKFLSREGRRTCDNCCQHNNRTEASIQGYDLL